jgi:hypothetical protein
MDDLSHGNPAPVDDPDGGRGLTRALIRWLPVAAVAGAIGGIPLAVWGDDWRAVPGVAGIAVALVGGVLAAVEDGRVQRRVSRERERTGGPPRI